MERFLLLVIGLALVQQAIAIRFIRRTHTSTTRCARMFEEYKTCGSACAPTCDQTEASMCIDECVAGCQCIDGYVRNKADGSCCLPSQCPVAESKLCPLHQVYDECGSSCALTCANYKNPPQMCTMMCVTGCRCESGYVKREDGSCCLKEEC